MTTRSLLACPECDALQRDVPLPPGGVALCGRCGATLFRDKPGSLDRTLAFTVAAAILFAIGNAQPLMRLDAQGMTSAATLYDTAAALYGTGMWHVGLLVAMTAIVVPAIELAALLYMLLPLHFGRVPSALAHVFRVAHAARHWGMVDVFVLGAFVSLVKLTQIAHVHVGPAMLAVIAYIVLLAAALASFEPRVLWARADALQS